MPNEDYLWDRSGPPDADIAHLEKVLAPYRAAEKRSGPSRSQLFWAAGLAAAATLLVTIVPPPAAPSEWEFEGSPLNIGVRIEAPSSGARLTAGIGTVELQSGAKLRVASQRHLSLEQGTLRAFIFAPPAKFAIDTPGARAIDLGCSYTLDVAPDGSGLLTVEHGWVAFQAGHLESFVPAGAQCRTSKHGVLGLPVFVDSSDEFQIAVRQFEITGASIAAMLALASSRDGLTLWHLMSRTSGKNRDDVVEAFAKLNPESDTAGLLAKDPAALDKAWNALGLGETEWWRVWKRDWEAP